MKISHRIFIFCVSTIVITMVSSLTVDADDCKTFCEGLATRVSDRVLDHCLSLAKHQQKKCQKMADDIFSQVRKECLSQPHCT
jgi:hypothetical protein